MAYNSKYTGAQVEAKLDAVDGKQDKITTTNKLPYSLVSGTPTIPTLTSQLQNNSGYVTGITKAMVTNALGYTPPTQDTNTNYYPSRSYSSGLQISTSSGVSNTCALFVPYATGSQAGVVSTGLQTFSGPKLFADTPYLENGFSALCERSINTSDLAGGMYFWDIDDYIEIYGNTRYISYIDCGQLMMKAGGFQNASDITLKDVQEDKRLTLDELANAPLFDFTWKESAKYDKRKHKVKDDNHHVGSSAQYWKGVLPTEVSGEEGSMSMNYSTISLASVISLAKIVKEQQKEIEELKAMVKELMKR